MTSAWLIPASVIIGAFFGWYLGVRTKRHELVSVRRENELIRTLVDSLPDFIYVKDSQCRFILANKFCCEAMGTTAEHIIGRTDFDFYPHELAKNFYDDEQKVLHSGQSLLSRQEDVVGRNRVTLSILTTKVPLKDPNGVVVGVIGIGRDISARVAAEKQLRAAQVAVENEMRERERMAIELRLAQKLESVGRLAAGIAHEVNTPIQYVGDSVYFLRSAFEDLYKLLLGYRKAAVQHATTAGDEAALTDLRELESDCDYEFLSNEVPKAIERSLEGTQRVASIVRAMKEFAHPDTNEQKAADINRALNTTLTVARSEYRHAARAETDLDNLPEVLCNIGELNQVFLNLIVNAAHAISDAGKDATSGVIQIKTRLSGNDVEITISDNGCGIAPENVEKIFDPFFTTKEVGRGTGQGLAIARSIVVDKHGGQIDVATEPGKGTSFVIRVPVAGRPLAAIA